MEQSLRKKGHMKLEKCQGLKEELEKMWEVKASVVPVVIRALVAVIPQIPGITLEISV